MAWMKYFRILSVSALLTCVSCNVIRREKDVDENIFLSNANAANKDIFEDEDNNYMHLDESSSFRLKGRDTAKNGNTHNHDNQDKITFVYHFARHGLCRNIEGKARLYTAMKSKLCHINSKFIAQLVDNLCTNKDTRLDNWVAELFDLNEDGFVDHFERHLYKTED